MRTQSHSRELFMVRLKHQLLRFCLRLGIIGFKMAWVRCSFVNIFHISAIENNARRAGVDESSDGKTLTGRNYVLSANHIGAMILLIRSPDACFGRDVK